MKKIISIITLILLLAGINSLQAQNTRHVTKSQVRQQKRIVRGAKSGELTRQEIKQLERQQRHINRSKKRAKADGVVTPAERVRLNGKQNRASRNIRRQKNDAQDRN